MTSHHTYLFRQFICAIYLILGSWRWFRVKQILKFTWPIDPDLRLTDVVKSRSGSSGCTDCLAADNSSSVTASPTLLMSSSFLIQGLLSFLPLIVSSYMMSLTNSSLHIPNSTIWERVLSQSPMFVYICEGRIEGWIAIFLILVCSNSCLLSCLL